MEALLRIVVFCGLLFLVQNAMIKSSFPIPEIDAWWGTEASRAGYNTKIRPFKIKYDKSMVADLKYRLKNHRPFTPPLADAAFHYGFNTNSLNDWVTYWADSYNFTDREAYMNKYPHFKTNIQGLDMHFVWIKPKVDYKKVEVVPLLILHGWPGSFLEYYKAIPIITKAYKDKGFAVEMIIPSLPGFAYSGAAVRPGLGASEMAVVGRNLMHRLGHKKFYIQGEDWGSTICTSMSTLFPDEVLGFHSCIGLSYAVGTWAVWFMGSINSATQSLVVKPELANRLYPLSTALKGVLTESGYMHVHVTKPDSLGVAMSDSPTGLLAYVLQLIAYASRSQTYTKKEDGGLLELYTRDELLDNLMLYWVNNAFTTSIRIYAETFNSRNVKMGLHSITTTVPLWSIQARHEIRYLSPKMLSYKFKNLLNVTLPDDGGHFLALEMPEVYAESVLTALTEFRSWHLKKKCKEEL